MIRRLLEIRNRKMGSPAVVKGIAHGKQIGGLDDFSWYDREVFIRSEFTTVWAAPKNLIVTDSIVAIKIAFKLDRRPLNRNAPWRLIWTRASDFINRLREEVS